MNINERNKEELTILYFKGQLTKAEEAAFLNWLNEKEENKEYLKEMTNLWGKVHIPLFKAEMKKNYRMRLQALLSSGAGKRQPGGLARLFSRMRKAAAFFILFVSVVAGTYYLTRHHFPGHQEIAYYETTVPYGARTQVTLPDKSVVWLNSGSTLRYSNRFTESREVSISGEAFFKVQSDSLHPFTVNTNELKVIVTGTEFNVKAYPDDPDLQVSLYWGKVQVSDETNASNPVATSLSPGQELIYDKENDRTEVSSFNADLENLWINGIISFEDERFDEIARKLERIFNTRIKIYSTRLPQERFSGSFSSRYSMEDILKEIDMDKKYKWRLTDDTLIIEDK